ncbi:hypothetical protein, partial [Dyella agri]
LGKDYEKIPLSASANLRGDYRLIWLLPLLALAVGSHIYAPLLLSLIGVFKGVVIAGGFSALSGVPWSSGRSMLL